MANNFHLEIFKNALLIGGGITVLMYVFNPMSREEYVAKVNYDNRNFVAFHDHQKGNHELIQKAMYDTKTNDFWNVIRSGPGQPHPFAKPFSPTNAQSNSSSPVNSASSIVESIVNKELANASESRIDIEIESVSNSVNLSATNEDDENRENGDGSDVSSNLSLQENTDHSNKVEQ